MNDETITRKARSEAQDLGLPEQPWVKLSELAIVEQDATAIAVRDVVVDAARYDASASAAFVALMDAMVIVLKDLRSARKALMAVRESAPLPDSVRRKG